MMTDHHFKRCYELLQFLYATQNNDGKWNEETWPLGTEVFVLQLDQTS